MVMAVFGVPWTLFFACAAKKAQKRAAKAERARTRADLERATSGD